MYGMTLMYFRSHLEFTKLHIVVEHYFGTILPYPFMTFDIRSNVTYFCFI